MKTVKFHFPYPVAAIWMLVFLIGACGEDNITPDDKTSSLLDGLISYWKLDGQDAGDAAGDWDLTLVNSPAWSSSGKINDAIDFGTTSDRYLQKTGINSGDKNTYTLAAWIYLQEDVDNDALNPWMHIMGMNSGIGAMAAGAAEVKLSLLADNKLEAMYHTMNGAFHGSEDVMSRESSTSIALNTWYHVVAVINSGDIELYINGVADGSNPVQGSGLDSNLSFSNGRVTIGNARLWQTAYVTSRWFRGKIDEAGIWDRPLTSAEVQALYNKGNGLQYPFDLVI